MRETVEILMESTPRGLNVVQMVRDMVREPDVQDVHDLHVWAIAGGMNALSAHLQVGDRPLSECDPLLTRLSTLLQSKYHIDHFTIQLECSGCESNHLYCNQGLNESRADEHVHGHEKTSDGVDVPKEVGRGV